MPRVLIVKTSSLGDVIHQCPALSDAARARPDLKFDWLVEEAFADVPRMHRDVDRVFPMALRRWRGRLLESGTWRELAALRRSLGDERYDVVLDTQGLLKSVLFGRLARGERHGYAANSAREQIASRFYDRTHVVTRRAHAVERNRALTAQSLGFTVAGAPDYGLRSRTSNRLGSASPYAVLLTMSSREDKLWPDGHWRSVIVGLTQCGVRCVLPWGSERERLRCTVIAQSAGAARDDEHPAPLVPDRMDIGDLAACLRDAKIVIGVDTGLTHLAVALETPAIGIYSSTDPALTGLHGARTRNLGGRNASPRAAEVLDAATAWLS